MTSAMRFSANAWLAPIQQVDARAAILIRRRYDTADPPSGNDQRALWPRRLVGLEGGRFKAKDRDWRKNLPRIVPVPRTSSPQNLAARPIARFAVKKAH